MMELENGLSCALEAAGAEFIQNWHNVVLGVRCWMSLESSSR